MTSGKLVGSPDSLASHVISSDHVSIDTHSASDHHSASLMYDSVSQNIIPLIILLVRTRSPKQT